MKFSELKEGEVVMLSKADFEDLKRQAFKHAVNCLAESLKENFPIGDAVGDKLRSIVEQLIAVDVAITAN